MTSDGIPETEQDANALRAYIPTETLTELNRICREESAQADKLSRAYDDATAEIKAIKERMRADRIRIKKLEAQRKKRWETPIYPRYDAGKDAAWRAAFAARNAAVANGEAPKFETTTQASERATPAA